MNQVHHLTGAVAALILSLIAARPASAQLSHCSSPGDWEQCALAAARFNYPPRGVIRQILVINSSGPPHIPYSGLLLRESADSVHGWGFLIWPAKYADDPLAERRCERRWQNDGGMLCMGRQDEQRDWRMVRDSLDRLGIATIPLPPAPAVRAGVSCGGAWNRPLPPLPPAIGESAAPARKVVSADALVSSGYRPLNCLRDIVFDGTHLQLTVWAHGVTWHYTISSSGRDPTATQLRDQAIAKLVSGLM